MMGESDIMDRESTDPAGMLYGSDIEKPNSTCFGKSPAFLALGGAVAGGIV
jgi:hypothetical protein